MSFIGKIEPDRKRYLEKALADWVACANVGDFARAIISPVWTSRAVYGSPIQAGKLLFLERLLLGGDIAIVHSFKRKLIIIPEETLTALLAALDE